MLSKEANERLTRVGPGTPMGELLRRYWYPVATVPELDAEPCRRSSCWASSLTLDRTDTGDLRLVVESDPARAYPVARDGRLDLGLSGAASRCRCCRATTCSCATTWTARSA